MASAVVGWLGKTLVGRLIVSYALNAVTNKLFGKKAASSNSSPTYSIGTLQTQTNSDSVMPIIYGKVKCAGNNLWQSGSGKTVQRLVGFGLGKNKGVSDVRFNDIPLGDATIILIRNTKFPDAYVKVGKVPNWGSGLYCYCNGGMSGTFSLDTQASISVGDICDEINNYAAYGWYARSDDESLGSDTIPKTGNTNCYYTPFQPTKVLLTDCDYTAYMGDGEQAIDGRVTGATQEDKAKLVGGMKYDAYLALTITAGDNLNGAPNITAVWEGRIVKIWDTLTVYHEGWSDNVWCVLDFMTSIDGCNISIENIDIQSFIDAAAYAQPADNSRRWSVNLILDNKKSRQDWLNDMLLCFRAWRTYQNGKHGILIDKPEPVSQIFTVKKTETIQLDWQELKEDVERIILKYRDPDYEWQNVGAPATMKPPFRNQMPLTKTVEVNGITNFKQASQHSWFYLNQAQTCGEYITYTCNKRALNRTIGDVVGIFDPITQVTEPGLTYKRYRILGMTEPQGISIQLYCREYNADLYTDQQGSVAPVVNITKLPNTSISPPAVTDLVADEYGWMNTSGVHISNIDVNCTPANYFDKVTYAVSISSDEGVTWRYVNTVSQFPYRIENVQNGDYVVGVQTVNKVGVISAMATTSVSVIGKDDLPPDVETLMVEKLSTGGWRFSFVLNGDVPIDLAGYRMKYNIGNSTWWDIAIPLHDGLILHSPFETNAVPAGTVTILIKTVDNAGGESENVADAILNLGDALTDNVLATFDFVADGFPGTKTGCHVENGSLVADDSGGGMYPADLNSSMYPADLLEQFYQVNWPAMTYEGTFTPDQIGMLSFAADMDGNAQIFYREQYPYSMYGKDYDPFYPDADQPMYKEGPWLRYAGKVEIAADIYQVRIEITSGTVRGTIRSLTAIVDVRDVNETVEDLNIPASGLRVPITKKYIRIKNVGYTIQDVNNSTAITIKIVDKDPVKGPLLIPYDKNNLPTDGVIDATVQGY